MRRPLLALALIAPACAGAIEPAAPGETDRARAPSPEPAEGPPPARGVPASGAAPSPAAAPQAPGACAARLETPARLRRLTQEEYHRTVSALVGKTVAALPFPTDDTHSGYLNEAQYLRVTDVLADRLQTAAEELATAAVANLAALLPCDPARAGEEACARRFLEAFAGRAYRRPASAPEVDALAGVYRLGREGADFRAGVHLALQVIFQSPNLLYRTELGAPEAAGEVVTLTPHEIAAQLAYLVTGDPPDAALAAAAASGELADPAARERHARRLLAAPGARPAFAQFLLPWLGVHGLETVQKDPKLSFTQRLAQTMKREAEALAGDVVFDGPATVRGLLLAEHTFVESTLARLYGLPAVSGSTLQKVPLPRERAGVLTLGGVLAAHASSVDSSPVFRGKMVRTRILCGELPAPPADLMVSLPPLTKGMTTRQRYAQHASDPRCAGCHALLDPLGYAFESFDAVGAFRAADNGSPVDASGRVAGTDVDGPFDGAVALARRLADSRLVRACFAAQWTGWALARATPPAERCAVERLGGDFVADRATIPDLLAALVRSSAFVERRVTR